MVTDSVPAIRVQNLVKRFGALTAVNGLELTVMRGECFGLLGPNGAGKTTTVEILEGLQQRDEGVVELLGMTWEKNRDELRERIGVQLQESQLYEKLTVEETIALFRSFYAKPVTVDEAIKAVDLDEKRKDWVGKLSGGQRQRLAVATSLVADPDIYFFDEPTTGLDPTARRGLWEVLTNIRSRGRTVVLTTHYMDEAERLCDRVAIVDRGRVIALGTPAELIASVGGDQIIELSTEPALREEDVADIPGLVSTRLSGAELRVTVKELHTGLPALLQRVQSRHARVVHVLTRQPTLEDVFLNLTGHKLTGTDEKAAA